MKKTFTLLRVLPVALVLSLSVALAQDETYVEPDQTTYEAPEADTVVYDEPTTYYASVVYQSAVIYNAPVYYIALTKRLKKQKPSLIWNHCSPATAPMIYSQ